MMTIENIKKKISELAQQREQILANANNALGQNEGALAVWRELLKELESPAAPPQTAAG